MRLIVGLGNPGKKYEITRHNVGFLAISKIKDQKSKIKFKISNKFNSEISQIEINGGKIILAKPQTFMNRSGEAVQKIKDYYKIGNNNIWVICDDINLDLGQIRIRKAGSDGGHNGLKSVIEAIGEDFWRIRVGIGSNQDKNIQSEDYVLQKFSKKEQKIITKSIDEVANLVIESISNGIKEETINIQDQKLKTKT